MPYGGNLMIYGVCAEPENAATLAEAGFEFVELHVQRHLRPEADEAAFLPQLEQIQAAALPCAAANCFIPGHLKITGPQVDFDGLARYVEAACERARRAGIETIVFGSGGARAIPECFDRRQAWGQLLDFGRMLGPVAERYGITIAVEPLNRGESNVLNSVDEGARYVREVDRASVMLLVDGYHWALERESVEDIVAAGPLLCHAHIATYRTRLSPGAEPCDFRPFFQALKDGGYDGRIAIEGKWDDMPGQAAEALAQLKRAART
jgi:sugar phosphate isomerase/epimerase